MNPIHYRDINLWNGGQYIALIEGGEPTTRKRFCLLLEQQDRPKQKSLTNAIEAVVNSVPVWERTNLRYFVVDVPFSEFGQFTKFDEVFITFESAEAVDARWERTPEFLRQILLAMFGPRKYRIKYALGQHQPKLVDQVYSKEDVAGSVEIIRAMTGVTSIVVEAAPKHGLWAGHFMLDEVIV